VVVGVVCEVDVWVGVKVFVTVLVIVSVFVTVLVTLETTVEVTVLSSVTVAVVVTGSDLQDMLGISIARTKTAEKSVNPYFLLLLVNFNLCSFHI
jgi:hypothetical protein